MVHWDTKVTLPGGKSMTVLLCFFENLSGWCISAEKPRGVLIQKNISQSQIYDNTVPTSLCYWSALWVFFMSLIVILLIRLCGVFPALLSDSGVPLNTCKRLLCPKVADWKQGCKNRWCSVDTGLTMIILALWYLTLAPCRRKSVLLSVFVLFILYL